MGSNRYNKLVSKPIDYSPKKKVEEEVKLTFEPCCVCHKAIVDGYYGRTIVGGVCSRACDIIYHHSKREIINGKEWL